MADNQAAAAAAGGDKKKRRAKYLVHPTKRKRSISIPVGRQGFLITCDGGREHQCAREAINLLDEFFERLSNQNGQKKPSSGDGAAVAAESSAADNGQRDKEDEQEQAQDKAEQGSQDKADDSEKNFDDLLEAEIMELRDKGKTQFVNIETGCNGIVFIDMLKGSAISPGQIAEYVVRTVATTRKSKTRFCLKLLPVEVTCYASAEEVQKVAEPFILRHFPPGKADSADTGLKFAVVYEARANSGIDRMVMIDAVARLVPKPHAVDLKKPQKTIVVQVVKTTCTVGVVNEFKDLAKYNLRQLTSARESKEKDEKDKE